jgi:hypothetical protein
MTTLRDGAHAEERQILPLHYVQGQDDNSAVSKSDDGMQKILGG